MIYSESVESTIRYPWVELTFIINLTCTNGPI